jgi:hypothetical protein
VVNTIDAGHTPHPLKKMKTLQDFRPSPSKVMISTPVKEAYTPVNDGKKQPLLIRKFVVDNVIYALLFINSFKLKDYFDQFSKIKYKKGTFVEFKLFSFLTISMICSALLE